MKSHCFKILIALGAALALCNCSDDSSSSSKASANSLESSSVVVVVTSPAWYDETNGIIIYPDGTVTDESGNVVGTADVSTGTVVIGETVIVVDLTNTPVITPESVSSSSTVVQSSSDGIETTNPSTTNSSAVESSSSVSILASSSSESVEPGSAHGNGIADPTGYSVASYSDILSNGQTGWSSRYWDACKPHCSWPGNVDTTSEATYQAGLTTAKNCNVNDFEVPTYTLSENVQRYWMGYQGTGSACDSTYGSKGVYTCTDMAPVAVNDTLAYGFVAAPGSNASCGQCFHLQFNGGNHDGNVKATHKALKGKHLIVMTSNIGYDVEEGQFDMMVPGGGPGRYDALTSQVGVSKDLMGAQYGGLLTACQSTLGYDATVAKYQECIIEKCDALFTGWDNLLNGCKWFAEWYMAADNPTYNWETVDCPKYLVDKYMTSINTTKDTRLKWVNDWSTFTGDVSSLETLECLTAEFPQGCDN